MRRKTQVTSREQRKSQTREHLREGIQKNGIPRLVKTNYDILETSEAEILALCIKGALYKKDSVDLLGLAINAAKFSDETLNKTLEFAGYGGRTKEAIYNLLINAAHSDDSFTRGSAYAALSYLNFPTTLDFLLDHAFKEKEGEFGCLCDTVGKILEEKAGEKERVIEKLKPLLLDKNPCIRLEVARLFIELGTESSSELAWKALMKEKDEDNIKEIFRSFAESPGARPFRSKEKFPELLVRFIKRQLEKCPSINSQLFTRIIPEIKDIEKFIEKLPLKSRELLLELGGSRNSVTELHDIISYGYFKAACENTLIETEIQGERFKYFILPDEILGDNGALNIYAYGVSDAVPEKFRPIVAYHEHIEGKTGSHEEARSAEIDAAYSLGIGEEHLGWLMGIELPGIELPSLKPTDGGIEKENLRLLLQNPALRRFAICVEKECQEITKSLDHKDAA